MLSSAPTAPFLPRIDLFFGDVNPLSQNSHKSSCDSNLQRTAPGVWHYRRSFNFKNCIFHLPLRIANTEVKGPTPHHKSAQNFSIRNTLMCDNSIFVCGQRLEPMPCCHKWPPQQKPDEQLAVDMISFSRRISQDLANLS